MAIHEPQEKPSDERRGAPRIRPEFTASNFGEVVDLSMSGVRLLGNYLAPESTHLLRLWCSKLWVGPLHVRVVRRHKIAMHHWESALEFIEIDARTSFALAQLMMMSRNRPSTQPQN